MTHRQKLTLFMRLQLVGVLSLLVVSGTMSLLVLGVSLTLTALSPDATFTTGDAIAASFNWFRYFLTCGALPTLFAVVPGFYWLVSRGTVNAAATLAGAVVVGVVSAAVFGSIAAFFVVAIAVVLMSFLISKPRLIGAQAPVSTKTA